MDLRLFAHSVLMVTEKDMRIYYYKGSVVIFGLLFPFIMFLTFFIGRNLDMVLFFPSFLGMMLFFSASSTGPSSRHGRSGRGPMSGSCPCRSLLRESSLGISSPVQYSAWQLLRLSGSGVL